MKPGKIHRLACTRDPFRVQKNAASLKHALLVIREARELDLPRSEERGLIEADSALGLGGERFTLPRSEERGLIEASRASAPRPRRAAPFRVQKNAASLKRAGSSAGRRGGRHLPRSEERGLIEASRGRSVRRPGARTFRVQKNAASLKLGTVGARLLYLGVPSAFRRTRPH